MRTVVFLTLIIILLLVYYYRNYAPHSEKFYSPCSCDPRFEITEQGLYEGNVIDHLSPGALNPFMFPYSAYSGVNSIYNDFKDDFEQADKMKAARARDEANEAKKLKDMSNNSTTDHAELVD